MTGMEIDWEIADKITLLNLQNQYEYLNQELKNHRENGTWMHPEDVMNTEYLYLPALRTLINYYGGEV